MIANVASHCDFDASPVAARAEPFSTMFELNRQSASASMPVIPLADAAEGRLLRAQDDATHLHEARVLRLTQTDRACEV